MKSLLGALRADSIVGGFLLVMFFPDDAEAEVDVDDSAVDDIACNDELAPKQRNRLIVNTGIAAEPIVGRVSRIDVALPWLPLNPDCFALSALATPR